MDDNVHPTHAMQLVDALLKAGKQFDWFMMHLEPETKDAYFANKKAT